MRRRRTAPRDLDEYISTFPQDVMVISKADQKDTRENKNLPGRTIAPDTFEVLMRFFLWSFALLSRALPFHHTS